MVFHQHQVTVMARRFSSKILLVTFVVDDINSIFLTGHMKWCASWNTSFVMSTVAARRARARDWKQGWKILEDDKRKRATANWAYNLLFWSHNAYLSYKNTTLLGMSSGNAEQFLVYMYAYDNCILLNTPFDERLNYCEGRQLIRLVERKKKNLFHRKRFIRKFGFRDLNYVKNMLHPATKRTHRILVQIETSL